VEKNEIERVFKTRKTLEAVAVGREKGIASRSDFDRGEESKVRRIRVWRRAGSA